jgi:predicted DNA-binding transcriptional regulator AlpA
MSDRLDLPSTPTARRRRRRLPPKVADAERLAELLGLGIRTIRSMDSAGKLPRPLKLGARTVWIIREIRDWLAAARNGIPPDRREWEAIRASSNGRHATQHAGRLPR